MTSRGLSAGNAAQAAASVKRPCVLFAGEFASGWLRLWSGVGDLAWGGYTWQGAGELLEVSALSESDEVVSRGVQVSLTASSSIVSAALGSARQGKPGRVYLGFVDAAGALVADPVMLFEGRLDVPEIEPGTDTCTVTIAYEDELAALDRPLIRRYTPEDQKLDDATDRGFEFVTALQDVSVAWGSSGR